jgi:hypothetical protein
MQRSWEYAAAFDFEAKTPQGLVVSIDMTLALLGDPIPQLPAS